MPEPNDLVLVISTTETRADAERLAEALTERNLAACVQIDGPIHSHYRWAGQARVSPEYRLLMKSRHAVWPELREKLASLHPFDEPQIVMLPIEASTPGYQAWVVEQTS